VRLSSTTSIASPSESAISAGECNSNAAAARAVNADGHFPTEKAALKCRLSAGRKQQQRKKLDRYRSAVTRQAVGCP
jgi:hypothetical protein